MFGRSSILSFSPRSATPTLPRIAAVLLCVAGSALPSSAWAQNSKPTKKSTPATQPATAPATTPATGTQPSKPVPESSLPVPTNLKEGPYLVKREPKKWKMRAIVGIRAEDIQNETGQTTETAKIAVSGLTFVWPIVPGTSAHEPVLGETVARFSLDAGGGKVEFDDEGQGKGDRNFEIVRKQADGSPYHSGTYLAKFGFEGPRIFPTARFQIEVVSVGYKLKFDEEAAVKVPWPKGPWPADAQSTLEDQMYVNFGPLPLTQRERSGAPDILGSSNPREPGVENLREKLRARPYDMKPIQEAVKKWTGGNPKRLPPVHLAKYLAGKVMESVRKEGDPREYSTRPITGTGDGTSTGRTRMRTRVPSGFYIQGAPFTLRSGKGSELDIPVLLAAVLREAGLPTRLVIGVERNEESEIGASRGKNEICAWVEFCLYDEAKKTINWVAIDVVEQMRQGSRAPDYDRLGSFSALGDYKEIRDRIPIAFGFHPPTAVVSYGSSAFWGIFATPAEPYNAFQTILLNAFGTSIRPGEQEEREKNRGKND